MLKIIKVQRSNNSKVIGLPKFIWKGLQIDFGDMLLIRPVDENSFLVEKLTPETHPDLFSSYVSKITSKDK